jgi:membrane fusion protein (multidrug efflux system)
VALAVRYACRVTFPWRLRGLVALTLLSSLACSDSPDSNPPDEEELVVVQAQVIAPVDLPRTLAAVGSLESPEMTTVASEIAGTVLVLDVPEGQRVASGTVLAQLDDREARAALAIARARRRSARDRLARLENLRSQSVSSEQAYEDALVAFETAVGQFDEAQTRLEKTTIRAPYSGVLGLSRVHVGQYLAEGEGVVEITQVDPLDLHFSMPQRFVGELALGQTTWGVVGRCGARFEGRVEAIDPRIDPSTRMVRLQAAVPNTRGELYPGMAVRIRLVVGEYANALVVLQEAVVRQGTKHIVFTLDAEDRAVQHEVQLGEFFVDGVHVKSGLEPGARVVVAGQQKLRPGTATRPLDPQATSNPNTQLGRFGASDCDST